MATMNTSPNIPKAVEAINYVESLRHHYILNEVLLQADRLHLERYGRQIYEERYVASWAGIDATVAQGICSGINWKCRKPNLDYLSESEIECLREAVVSGLSGIEFPISLEAIVSTLPNAEIVAEHLDRY